MNFIAKKTAYDELFGSTHIEADKQLMHKLSPQHDVLKKGVFDINKYAADLLWALLDFASRDEIVKNRRVVVAARNEAAKAEEDAKPAAAEAEEDARITDEAAAKAAEDAKPAAADADTKAGGKKKADSKSKSTRK